MGIRACECESFVKEKSKDDYLFSNSVSVSLMNNQIINSKNI